MKKFEISTQAKSKHQNIKLGIIKAKVKVEKFNEYLWNEINLLSEEIKNMDFEQVKEIPTLKATREAYKNFGKDPSRYRPSAESLFRRIIKSKNLYQINNVVDAINFISLKTGYSIGGYDYDKIKGETITLGLGSKDEIYEGIGRGKLNIENLPVLRDDLGAFGSPTSDSERTKIDNSTKEVLLVIFNFGGEMNNFETEIQQAADVLKKYCFAQNLETKIIST